MITMYNDLFYLLHTFICATTLFVSIFVTECFIWSLCNVTEMHMCSIQSLENGSFHIMKFKHLWCCCSHKMFGFYKVQPWSAYLYAR